jgi:spore coat protein U-like protein
VTKTKQALLVLVLAAAAQAGWADTICRVTSNSGLAFGEYDTLSPTPRDSQAIVGVACDRNAGPQYVTIALGVGPGTYGSSVNARKMRSASGELLEYGLYRDAARSSVWGFSTGVDTGSQLLDVPNKGTQSATFVLYARIPPLQDVSAGLYSDSVQITLTP